MQRLSSSLPSVVSHLLFSWLPRTQQWHEAQTHVKSPQWLILFCFYLNICILGNTFHKVTMKTLERDHTGQAFRKDQPQQLGPEGKKTCLLHGLCHSICFSRHSKVLAPSPMKRRVCFIRCKQNTTKKCCVSITTTQELRNFLNIQIKLQWYHDCEVQLKLLFFPSHHMKPLRPFI